MEFDTPSGPVVPVCSGEAYNYVELRKILIGCGHVFTTDSDTEVVLHGYLERGEGVTERLNGIYAFAVWDGRCEKLMLIRDRMGVKPLYVYPTVDGVIFGSEPKAILVNPLVKRRVDVSGLRELVVACRPGAESMAATTFIESMLSGDDLVRKQALPNLAAGRWQLDRWI